MKIRIYLINLLLILFFSCQNQVNCVSPGGFAIFTATFESDDIGSPPDLTTNYGPRAELFVTGTATVEQDAEFGTQVLWIERGGGPQEINFLFGDSEEMDPCEEYSVVISLRGAEIPQHLISSWDLWVEALNGARAFHIKLYDDSYQILINGSFSPLVGNYDASVPHELHIRIDPLAKTYSICINNQAFIYNRSMLNTEFDYARSLKLWMPPTVTEAFSNVLLIDEIRVLK